MEADFSGYATKAGLRCSDGRTIMPDAFKDQDGMKVPLVWQHGHDDPDNVLGHAVLENRPDGVYAYAFFNGTTKAQNSKILVQHKDITSLSIYANQLVERSKNVLHGAIREVSLVLSGANPGALIDFVSISHSDGDVETLEDEAVIYTGLPLEHEDLAHADKPADTTSTDSTDGPTIQDVYDTLNDDQKALVDFMVGTAVEEATSTAAHSDDGGETSTDTTDKPADEDTTDKPADEDATDTTDKPADEDATDTTDKPVDSDTSDATDETDQSIIEHDALTTANKALTDANKNNSPFPDKDMLAARTALVAAAKAAVATTPNKALSDATDALVAAKTSKDILAAAKAIMSAAGSASHSDDTEADLIHQEGIHMNVFEKNGATKEKRPTLSHDQLKTILEEAKAGGSLRDAFLAHVDDYGITNIDYLFPDAQTITSSPDFISRRMDWVQGVLGGSKHSPFSRIKSIAADITADEARAKGYVKASLKKNEVISLLKRVTIPTTIYKKQKLDRDDMLDITDLDVVAWLKAEMRVMLDEEVARAALIGDGREPDDEDKINEENIRPIAYDDEMYAHQVTVASNISPDSTIEAILRSRTFYKGSGTPTFYTTDPILTDMLLIKDTTGRRIYNNTADLAATLRVADIVVVEPMEDVPDLLGIMVNMADYTFGADKGGEVSMFDDFDIDYNQFKYLIETRLSGCLTKPKSAVVIKRTSGTTVSPTVPTYNPSTHTITIPSIAGVDYVIGDTTQTAGPVVITETTEVEAIPADGYSFPHNIDTEWTYTYTA
jgi:hypothetical protein